jgi:predicted nucleic acid-binding protein
MKAYFLDTSALLAHYLNESGARRVQAILEEEDSEVSISALSVAEMARRLVAMGTAPAAARSTALEYAGLSTVASIDTATSVRAFEIGSACEARLPQVDALIAAGALLSEATLVHRDPHFNMIPAGLISREEIY